MTLGNKLQLLRKARGMSQEQLAEALGVSQQAVSKWELDATLPDTANVVALSRMFGVSTDYLLVEENSDIRSEEKQYEQPRRKRDIKLIVGAVMAGFGALGWFAVYIASRFVEVMVPFVYRDQNGQEWTQWDSSRTDVNFGRFVDEYHLEGLLVVMAALFVAGVILLLWDRYLKKWIAHVREKMNGCTD